MGTRVVEVAPDDHVDRLVEGGAEEHALAVGRLAVEQTLYGRQEPEVSHVVGLVEHRDLDIGETGVSLGDEILEPAGGGHHDVDAAAQRGHLRVLADAAEDGHRGEVGGRGQRLQGGVDLADELAGRGKDQRSGGAAPRRTPRGGEAGDHGQQEGVRLAGARAAAAEHVAPGEGVRQCGCLDGCGFSDVHVGEDRREVRGYAKQDKVVLRSQGIQSIRSVSHQAVPVGDGRSSACALTEARGASNGPRRSPG